MHICIYVYIYYIYIYIHIHIHTYIVGGCDVATVTRCRVLLSASAASCKALRRWFTLPD